MNNAIIDRLFSSFSDLETAIGSARATLASKEYVPDGIMDRIKSYDGILDKQRTLANELCTLVNAGKWDAVARHVGLINGLSALIRDDARAILSALSGHATESYDKAKYC